MTWTAALLACASTLSAQAPAQVQPAGLEADWDIAVVLNEMSAHAGRLLPFLDRIDTKAWIAMGASDTYDAQLESSKDQVRALAQSAKALAANPEKLSASIELLFRLHSVETMLNSLEEGIRKYQNPADAQALVSLEAQNGANRDRFEKYILNLAAEREKDLQVMDREAQRCRGLVTQAPPKSIRKK